MADAAGPAVESEIAEEPSVPPDPLFQETVRALLTSAKANDPDECARALKKVLTRSSANRHAKNLAVYNIVVDGRHCGRVDDYDRRGGQKEDSIEAILVRGDLAGVTTRSRVSEMISSARAHRVLGEGKIVHAREQFSTRVLARLWGAFRDDKRKMQEVAREAAGLAEKDAVPLIRVRRNNPTPSKANPQPQLGTLAKECRRFRTLCKAIGNEQAREPADPNAWPAGNIEQGLTDIASIRTRLDASQKELQDLARHKQEEV